MKCTYLIRKYKHNGGLCLVEVSGDTWKKIIARNKSLPKEEKRYFITDRIMEADGEDRMYIEVSLEEYQEWNSKNTVAIRKRKYESCFTTISLDDELSDQEDLDHEDILADEYDLESEVIDSILISELRKALKDWPPWATEILDSYLSGRKKECTSEIAQKYDVSEQTARSYKKKVENFLKYFLF